MPRCPISVKPWLKSIRMYLARRLIPVIMCPLSSSSMSVGRGYRKSGRLHWTLTKEHLSRTGLNARQTVSTSGSSGKVEIPLICSYYIKPGYIFGALISKIMKMFGFYATVSWIKPFLINIKENFFLLISLQPATFKSRFEMRNQIGKPSQPLTSVTNGS